MSKFVKNQSCKICGKCEKSLVNLKIGIENNLICYQCMLTLGLDIKEFLEMNYTKLELTTGIAREEIDKKSKERINGSN